MAQVRGGRRADGILADTRVADERVAYLAAEGLPFVAFGRTEAPSAYPYVDLDSQAGALAATSHMRTVVARLLKRTRRISAVVAASDLLAIYAMRAAEALGLRVGQDLAVVGFDDLPLAAHTRPSLTTVRQPFDQICDQLIDTLLAVITGDSRGPRQTLVAPELIVRQSSAKAATR